MKPGIYERMARDDYDRLSSFVNWSRLKTLDKSPAHYREVMLHPEQEDTDPRKRGRATHLAVFEPELFRERYVVYESRRAGGEWEAFRRKHEPFGREILTEGMHQAAIAIATAARADARALKYLSGGRGEITMIWDHVVPELEALPGYTLHCKGRPDFEAKAGALVDLKTTRDASPAGFAREVMRYNYHAQAAMYVDGHAAATGGAKLPYVFVAVEAAAPYAVTVFRVPDEILQLGREKYRALMDRLSVCIATSEWPAYATEELDLLLPEWMDPDGDPTSLGLEIGE